MGVTAARRRKLFRHRSVVDGQRQRPSAGEKAPTAATILRRFGKYGVEYYVSGGRLRQPYLNLSSTQIST